MFALFIKVIYHLPMKNITLILILLALSSQSYAFSEFLNSARILERGEYDASTYLQSFSSDRSGLALSGAIDLPFTKQTNIRFTGGFGSYDFSLGSALKWVPIKDDSQHSFNLGGVVSAEYALENSINFFLFKFSPFISKHISWEYGGGIEPYLSIPIGNFSFDSQSEFSTQIIVGTNLKFKSLNYMSFSIEGGFKIKNAESYLAVMTTIQLQK